ncbi:MAG: helix-turn-helix domain-containing protein [Verrucomicrobiaceae bacterium]|nr:helix-turn-helix domain-containing protein [Verrucomicrobiaceae bacterium]
MKDEDFQKLVQSVHQMGSIMRGEKVAHRRTTRHKTDVRSLRERVELTQSAFARMIGVSVRTLQNWEQGRREPDGPAKALLKVVERQPKAVLAALHAA